MANKSFSLFIFGGTGDLAKKKLFPSLSRLYSKGYLQGLDKVYSLARSKREDWEQVVCQLDRGLGKLCNFIPFDVKEWKYYSELEKLISQLKGQELIFFLSISPYLYEDTIRNLGRLLRNHPNPRKIVIEKPFGFDLKSAKKLNDLLHRYFIEEEIYRIDHFLGKDTVQNIFSLRFSNTIFEGIWNRNFIDHVQILALESVNVEGRGEFYNKVGAIRDMLQNHMLQMLAFTAMEPPAYFSEKFIRDEKVKVLRSTRIEKLKKGQYEGYLEDVGTQYSNTETFVCAKVMVENFRWYGVPFYLMTGKALKKKLTQVTVVFKEIPQSFVRLLDCKPHQNRITFQMAPQSKLTITFELRPPTGGFIACPVETSMEYTFPSEFEEAYEVLLLDVIEGDQSLFIRSDEIEALWEVVQTYLDTEDKPFIYPRGIEVPEQAVDFLQEDGIFWYLQ
ncbi:MAG: glucose-6-phosphate dehydrogenase [Aquificaceae bacterium]|nr:glucose-6-phosphate dehydrogenase [Aquificaceae bacterium]MDW8424134.1 glucose-6-phosphate dehydrogenase [Aquificaceae bacterium]